jgi:hypothetical protein
MEILTTANGKTIKDQVKGCLGKLGNTLIVENGKETLRMDTELRLMTTEIPIKGCLKTTAEKEPESILKKTELYLKAFGVRIRCSKNSGNLKKEIIAFSVKSYMV